MTPQPPPGPPGSTAAPRPTGDDAARLRDREEHRRARDADLAEHDLSDHDERLFRAPTRPWRHLTGPAVGLLVAGLITTGAAATHLSAMSGGTIGNAVLLPDKTPVNLRLSAGESRMIYAERSGDAELTRCTVTGAADEPVPVQGTRPVILQGSDVLWHGQSTFTAPRDGDYTVTCSSARPDRMVRIGEPVGLWDIVLTLAAAGVGGIATLTGLALLVWGRRGRAAAGRARGRRP